MNGRTGASFPLAGTRVAVFTALAGLVEKAAHLPGPTWTIYRVSEHPQIDGLLDRTDLAVWAEWLGCPVVEETEGDGVVRGYLHFTWEGFQLMVWGVIADAPEC